MSDRHDCVTCYTRAQLVNLASYYNKEYSHRIPLNGSKMELWNAINDRMIECEDGKCSRMSSRTGQSWRWDWGWGGRHQRGGFAIPKPLPPQGRNMDDERPWLSTKDIHDVLQRYQYQYPDFQSVGPVPIDFCNIGHVLCKMDVVRAYKKGTRTIGVVFNTDPSTQPGKHWISMFIDMRRPVWEINYFDSFGNAPVAPEIVRLVSHLEDNITSTGVKVIKKLNCSSGVCTSSVQHQMNDSDCGMYSIHFIVKRLEGVSWETLVRNYSIELNDDNMGKLRRYYFQATANNS